MRDDLKPIEDLLPGDKKRECVVRCRKTPWSLKASHRKAGRLFRLRQMLRDSVIILAFRHS